MGNIKLQDSGCIHRPNQIQLMVQGSRQTITKLETKLKNVVSCFGKTEPDNVSKLFFARSACSIPRVGGDNFCGRFVRAGAGAIG